MRLTKLIVLFVIFTLALSIAVPVFAADGAATYKAKCAACHGPEGQGKIGPALKGTASPPIRSPICSARAMKPKKRPIKKRFRAWRATMRRPSQTT